MMTPGYILADHSDELIYTNENIEPFNIQPIEDQNIEPVINMAENATLGLPQYSGQRVKLGV